MKLSPSHYELQIISKQVFLIHENLPNHLQQVKHNKYRVLVEIKKIVFNGLQFESSSYAKKNYKFTLSITCLNSANCVHYLAKRPYLF